MSIVGRVVDAAAKLVSDMIFDDRSFAILVPESRDDRDDHAPQHPLHRELFQRRTDKDPAVEEIFGGRATLTVDGDGPRSNYEAWAARQRAHAARMNQLQENE